jgi:ADP-ribose pyrophosphatase YjhB (NUDIX family)
VVDPDALELLAVGGFDHPTGRRLVTVAYVVDRARTGGEPTPGSDATEARFRTLAGLASADGGLGTHDHDRVLRALDRL